MINDPTKIMKDNMQLKTEGRRFVDVVDDLLELNQITRGEWKYVQELRTRSIAELTMEEYDNLRNLIRKYAAPTVRMGLVGPCAIPADGA